MPGGAAAGPALLVPETELHRRILQDWVVTENGESRLSSMAYIPRAGEHCSAFVAAECQIYDVLNPYPIDGASVGMITIGVCHEHGYQVQRDVIPGEHPSHVHLIQPTLAKKALHKARKAMAANTRWVAGTKQWGPPPVEPVVAVAAGTD